jgi:photosystem II stability/assembly factor-like uncharacterized protein
LVAIGLAVALVVFIAVGGGDSTSGPSANRSATASPFVGGDLHSLVADPANPSRLFVGGHEAVAVSQDGGVSWRQVPSLEDADAMGWAFSATGVLVGGHPGLQVSDDGGRTFALRNDGLPATDIHGIGSAGEVVYAASPQVGVFASPDGGHRWEIRTRNAGQSFMGRMLVDPNDANHVVAPDMQAGAVESVDGGRTWKALGGVRGAMWVTWDPADIRHLIVSAMGSAAETRDGGRTWTRLDAPADAMVVEMNPGTPGTLYAAIYRDGRAVVRVSRDGGATWAEPSR